ncbi:MAG: FHA domain-containing protein [Oscillatoriales cyanobacterium SM2_1_8]|nr:FHA domain-containing protein [Oscillatoriales cyanobacterium SM2_1_8]
MPLGADELVVGRDAETCQIHLPHNTVSRQHLKVARKDSTSWWVTDTSTNGTTLETEYGDRLCLSKLPNCRVWIRAGDRLQVPRQPKPLFTLTIVDPNRTQDSAKPQANQSEMGWTVDVARQRLCHCFRGIQWPSPTILRPLPHTLLMFMAQKNLATGPETLILREDLIQAVWGDGGSETELNKLIKEIRDATTSSLIETRKGIGYILKVPVCRQENP